MTANTKALAPTLRIPAGLVRLSTAPGFLPDRLIRDETGNWEIIGPVTDDFEEMETQMRTVEAAVAAGSYQAHVAVPISRLEHGAAGYTLFSTDLLTFRKFSSQLAHYRKAPKAVPGAFFLHGFLSVFSDMKKDMMLKVLEVVKPETFARTFSAPVQQMLKAVLPDGEPEDPRPYYFTFLYRPFEQFTTLLDLDASSARALRRGILQARTRAVAALEDTATRFVAGSLSQKDAKDQAMLVLANFCDETGLLPHLEAYLSRHTGEQDLRKVAGG